MTYDIAVVGGGPAGLSAAIQGRQRGKSVLLLSAGDRDGPLEKAERIDNYPGLPGIQGRELWERLRSHAREMGCEFRRGRALNILQAEKLFYLGVESDVVQALSVVLAIGVIQRNKLPGEAELLGAGVSYCATCDGMLYRGKNVVVAGWSQEAPEEANYLRELGCAVTYVASSRPTVLRTDVAFVKGSKLEIFGEKRVEEVRIGETRIPCAGVFLLRSAVSPADLLPGLALREGFIETDRNMETNLPGVFAAGDCTGAPLQAAKAVGEGQTAGHRAAEYADRIKQDR